MSARGPAGNRSLEEEKRLGRIKNLKAFSGGHGNSLLNHFLAFSAPVRLEHNSLDHYSTVAIIEYPYHSKGVHLLPRWCSGG